MDTQNPVGDPGQEASLEPETSSGGKSLESSQPRYWCWQAPDRDSPAGDAIDLDFNLEIVDNSNKTLTALLQLDGVNAYDDSEVLKETGQNIGRSRRWGKFFERMGLMYREDRITRLTPLGKKLAEIPTDKKREFRRSVARDALRVLSRYQLKNPADDPQGRYPDDCDVLSYWCIWRAAVALDGRLHWDELNRELMRVLRIEDLDARIEKIRIARSDPDYDPAKGGSSEHPLDVRCYEEPDPPPGKTSDGQVRDHYTTPWLKKAGFGGLLLDSPGKGGEGYWTIPNDLLPEIKEALRHPPQYRNFKSRAEWFEYYGRLDSETDSAILEKDLTLPDDDPVWVQVQSLLASGSLAIIMIGPPGTSKTWYARRLARKIADKPERVCQVQFHPSFSYDDFIEGYVPVSGTGSGHLALFQIVPKIFTTVCDRARSSPDHKFVLVIDEINRGDVSRIFGELLTYLEPDYRHRTFTLSYSGRETTIPNNVVILGTMNPFDRSITELDDALERRFDRIALNPSIDILRTLLNKANTPGPLVEKIIRFFQRANELVPHGLGHAFFVNVQGEADLIRVWNHSLRFVLEKTFRFDAEKFQEIKEAYQPLVTDAALLK